MRNNEKKNIAILNRMIYFSRYCLMGLKMSNKNKSKISELTAKLEELQKENLKLRDEITSLKSVNKSLEDRQKEEVTFLQNNTDLLTGKFALESLVKVHEIRTGKKIIEELESDLEDFLTGDSSIDFKKCCEQIKVLKKINNELFRHIEVYEIANREIQESLELFMLIFNKANDAIIIENNREEILQVNDQACIFFEYTRKELLEMHTKDLEAEGLEGHPPISLYTSNDSRRNERFEHIVKTKSGKIKYIDLNVTKIKYQDNYIFLSIIRDITDKKFADEKLMESYEKIRRTQDELIKLEQRNSVLAMAVTANHELNQPLTVLKVFMDMFKMSFDLSKLTEKQREYLHKMEGALKNMTGILDKYANPHNVKFEKYSDNIMMVVFEDEENK